MPTVHSRDAQLQEFMQMYELRAACNVCTQKHSRISYSIIATPHRCSHDLLLVKVKVRGHKWRPVFMRPSHPRPFRYEVCWYFKEDVGCYMHRDRCTFASSPEEAAVWNLQKHTNLDNKALIHLITQRKRLHEQSRQEDGQSSSHDLFSYQEKLLEEYRRSSNEILIISEQVDDVCVTHDENLCLDCLQESSEIKWKFTITTERSLAHVALLKVENGAVFSLSDSLQNTFPPITYTTGHHLRTSGSTYQLSVSFLSFHPGVYEQWLVFDFDIRPVLLRKLKVRVGQQFHVQPDEAGEDGCAEILSNERWNRGNKVVMPFFARKEEDEQLLSKYKPPQMNLQFNPHADHSSPLHRGNYKERAHHFLFREEIAEEKLISRLNVCGTVFLSNQFSDGIEQFFTAPGMLFATLKVSCSLTPDSPEGLMLKRAVQMALVSCISSKASVSVEHRNHVYEALVNKQSAGEGHISLQLSAQCVSELQLRKETRCKMEVQFQLNRLPFCQIHQAIDHLPDLHNVLPDFSNCCVPVNITKQSELNNKQQIALNFILGKCEVNKLAPPLLIYGPFGTGKTLCLASAAKKLALRSQNKVLICTYTNSSADLYVREHFHPYITNGHPTLKLLRIKANKSGFSIKATDDITLKYCLCSPDRKAFILPKRSDLQSHRIIITTTSMTRHLRELRLPEGFFSHIFIDEASQMLEGEALMALGLADKHTRVVLAGDHMQMAPKLFAVTDDKQSEHTLLSRLFRYYQDQSSNIAKKSRVIFNENYRSTAVIVDFVSAYFYVSDGIMARGDVPPHPRLHPLIFQHVIGECCLSSNSMSWFNYAEVNSVVNVVQGVLTDWPVEWGDKEPKQICVVSAGQQVEAIRVNLRKKGVQGVCVQNLANIQGKQFRVIIITTVHTRENLLQSESSCLEFFNDTRALNTALTRAQSLVVVVGDAGALCCFGKCSKIWRAYIEHCISKGSVKPDHLTRDVLQQDILEISKFQKTEKIEISESYVPPQAQVDSILKEMEDYDSDAQESDEENEQKRPLFSTSEKESLLELVRKQPAIYRHGELVMEGYQSGFVVPYDKPSEHIYIEGRKNIGMSFPGDEVVVETRRHDEGYLTGTVLGFTKRLQTSSEFVCLLENENYHKRPQNTDKHLPKMMIPLNHKTTKIRVLVKKETRNYIPVWNFVKDNWTITRTFLIDEQTKQNHVFVVQILGWKEHCSFPLGRVTDVLPIGTSLEEGLDILKAEFKLMSPPLIQETAFSDLTTDDKNRRDFRGLQTFTIDPTGAEDLDDAISVNDLGSCYEIGVHVADVASFVSKDSSLDSFAKEMGATFYSPGKEPTFMFPKHLATTSWSLLPDKDRRAISLIVKVEKQSGIITKKTFQLAIVNSKKKLTYKEAEEIISQCDGELKFDSLEDCVRVAYHFAKSQRKARLKEDWSYSQPDKQRKPGEREANQMIEELNIMFNHEVSKFLTENMDTKLCTPLRCQAPPMADQLNMICDQHMELIPFSSHLTFHMNRNRVDLNNTTTFTVCSPGSREGHANNNPNSSSLSSQLRDAISVSDSEYHFEIGVHKADFFSYVSGGNIQNLGAQSDMWSLMPGKKRCALSLILKVEKKKGKLVEQKLVLSCIKASTTLSYNEIDSIINQPRENEMRFDSVEGCILVACRFALDHKKQRLSGHVDGSNPANLGSPEDNKCRVMMEELKLMFKRACDQLIDRKTPFPNTFSCPVTALPEVQKRLQRYNEKFGSLEALEETLDSNIEENYGGFIILTSVWEQIELAALKSDFYKMADLISTDDIHPQLIPAIVQLNSSFKKAFFIRSLSCKEALLGHYSLHLESYTHASSPIRRYIDVVLQRLMHAVLSNRPVEYSQTDIDLLCDKCKRGEIRAQEYENKAESLCLAVSLQKQSIYKVAFVTHVRKDHESFKLSFPFDKGTFPDKLPVKYRNLQLEDQPIFEKLKQVTLTWKKRIYSMSMTQSPLQNMRFCSEIQQSTWHAIVEAVRDEMWEEAKSLILAADVKDNSMTNEVHDTSRLDPDHTFKSEGDHYTDFTLVLKVGDTVQVQLTSERDRGYWAPAVQLLSLSSGFEICMEHTDNPIKCFSKPANRPSKGHYYNVEEYVQIWKPLCEMESSATAVDDSDCVVIENVNITWNQSFDGSRLYGTFSLPVEYVKKWAIEFDLAKCFLCIRKRYLKQNQASESELDPKYFTWVAHGVTTQCLDSPENSVNKFKIIYFSIKYTTMNIPNLKRNDTFTVEVIPKLLPDIRKESAVNNLTVANELVKNIALRHRIAKESSEPAVYLFVLMREEPPAGLPRLNESQFKALEQALNKKFTLIQGPPGTGKTVVGAYIVYWFSQLNSKNPWKMKEPTDKDKREVILYCGPSNKSVDVVAEYLLKFGKKLKLLRVYSRQMEMQEYPYPGSNLQLSRKSLRQERSKCELRDITLHHRIRMSHNPDSQEILDFDKRIALNPDSLTDVDIEQYKKLLNSARLFELKSHNIILCTCTAAASPNLTKTLSARQILIDECAMATEPQTLVPLVSFKPEKVVLLGDHKQLRPIVKNEHVRRLGMTRSLFECYMERARMLDTQYRMHEEICRFPSETYYQGRLKTDVPERTSMLHAETERARQSKHTLFGDIRGVEISLVISTARGNENSKANVAEVKKAVEICNQLVSVGRVRQEEIAILSPYNAQVAKIREKLFNFKLEKITATTITKSQGSEWRYVILSMVRSCPSNEVEPLPSREWLSKHIGFVGDENQINVGITRAQDGLCILGNQEVLNCSPAWKKLLKHYSGQGCVVSADQITVHSVR